MNINDGFQIDVPPVFVPWGVTEAELIRLLGEYGLHKVTSGYHTLSCVSLDGLTCEIGLHFTPRSLGLLRELEFFRRAYPDQVASFEEFQRDFEVAYGKPTRSTSGSEGFPYHEWRLGKVKIEHYVFDRFGPEEHMRVRSLHRW